MLRILLYTTSFFILTFLTLIFLIFNGINISKFSNEDLKVKNLYLKYDNKFILKIEELEIQSSTNSEQNIFNPSIIGLTDEILKYFKLIKIDKVIYDKEYLSLKFQKNHLLINYEETKIDIDFKLSGQNIIISSDINLLKYNTNIKLNVVALTNSLSLQIDKPIIDITSQVIHPDFKAKVNGDIKNGELELDIQFLIKIIQTYL